MQLPEDYNELKMIRYQKIEELKNMAVNPYPYKFTRTHTAKDVVKQYDELGGEQVSVAGRIMSLRKMGRASFAHIVDKIGRASCRERV